MHSICTIFAKTKIIRTMTFNYDVIVVGAGHAGCEAAAAASTNQLGNFFRFVRSKF